MKMQIITVGVILLAVFSLSISGAAQENQTNETDLVDDIEPYEGSVGPGSALYGLKIALENLDEALTLNANEKLRKQLARTELRIAEAKAELRRNNTEAAGRALERFQIKIEATGSLISGIAGEDAGLLNAQNMTVKHQYVLERLLESHPNNTGLLRAYNNSLRLEEKFENKTERKLERVATKGRLKIKIREIEREKIEIKAKIIGNATQVKVEVKFLTNSTENSTIAQDILGKIRLSSENISRIMGFEAEEEEEEGLKTELEAKARVEPGATKVEAEYKFSLNTTNRTEILEGVYETLWALTVDDVTEVLKINAAEELGAEKAGIKEEKRGKKEDRNRTEVTNRNGREVEDEENESSGDR